MKGEAAFLNCDTLGDPDPEVTWKKDDVILDPTSDLDITMTPFGSLEFSKVEVADDGRYVCIATNPAGSAVKDFILIVQGGYTSELSPLSLTCVDIPLLRLEIHPSSMYFLINRSPVFPTLHYKSHPGH